MPQLPPRQRRCVYLTHDQAMFLERQAEARKSFTALVEEMFAERYGRRWPPSPERIRRNYVRELSA